jgi:hypothetical protein
MMQELRHRIDPFSAGWTAWDHDPVPAFCYRRRILDKVIESVAFDLGLERPQKFRFFDDFS